MPTVYFLIESHSREQHATDNGYFARSLVPIADEYLSEGCLALQSDDGIRHSVDAHQVAALPPTFEQAIDQYRLLVKERYPEVEFEARHSAANSPALCDGASLLILASEETVAQQNLVPRAKVSGFANASDEPLKMLTGHLRATEKLLRRADLTADDIDLWEVNESFASTVLLYQQHFGIDSNKLNVNGSAIAMGHPLGATGGNLLVTLVDELERSGQQRGVVAICGGAGVGVATLIERLQIKL